MRKRGYWVAGSIAAALDTETRRYTAGRNVISFAQEADGTRVTLDLFPYPAETYLVRESGEHVQVEDANGKRRLEGRWQDGELIDPATGLENSLYWQQITWDTPNPATALSVCKAEQNAGRDSWDPKGAILVVFFASFAGIARHVTPRTKWERAFYERHRRLWFIELIVLCIVPFAAAVMILRFR